MKKTEAPQEVVRVDDGVDMQAVKDPARAPVTVTIYRYEDLASGGVIQATIECILMFDRAGAVKDIKACTVHKEVDRNGKKLAEVDFRKAPLPLMDLKPTERMRAIKLAVPVAI